MSVELNSRVLMSGADYFDVVPLNPYSFDVESVDREKTMQEAQDIRDAFIEAGIEVATVPPPQGCQDGIFTANWGLCSGDTVILSNLPGPRKNEEAYAESALRRLGKTVVRPPYRFSGQGDALKVGPYLLVGSHYRTDVGMHDFLAKQLPLTIVPVETVPELDGNGEPVINGLSGWPDSFFYDLDLAVSILRNDLIAWCPDAFTAISAERIRALPLDKIEVSLKEAKDHFACNLVSTGETVIMSARAPKLQAEIERHGLKTITPMITELAKGGGYIRCTSLTLD